MLFNGQFKHTWCQHFHLCSINSPSAVCWSIVTMTSSMNIDHYDRIDAIGAVKLDREKRIAHCPWWRLLWMVESICVPITGVNCIPQRTFQMLCCVNITSRAWFWHPLSFWWYVKQMLLKIRYYSYWISSTDIIQITIVVFIKRGPSLDLILQIIWQNYETKIGN